MGYRSRIVSNLTATFTLPVTPQPSEQLRALAEVEGFPLGSAEAQPFSTEAYLNVVKEEIPNSSFWFLFEIDEDLSDGTQVCFEAVGEEGKAYDLEDELKKLANITRDFNGSLNGDVIVLGEDPGDVWKVSFKDNISTKDEVEMVWKSSGEKIEFSL